ncbi:glycosyltransferase [Chelativorans xinjiangense]|uniref:glycosyltransferase n=1 Tax=Chelativorans xinjiangense TaxID=2681485 RepID=UPI001916588E|nr:glycosyltransferase [Chelativorans xinjiangense]
MFTNTFSPHVGGVAHSVAWLAEDLRSDGHRVLVIAPEFAGMPANEPDVVRVPAVQRFRGSDFSVPIPLSRSLDEALDDFEPEIVHSHHPFLLGDTALRVSASRKLPVLYTYHTRYELYGHYLAQDAPALQRLVLSLALGYSDLSDAVIAPSRSMAIFLADHGVRTPVTVIPTGIELARFGNGDGTRARSVAGIPEDAFIVGHVGRLAPEKNLEYLTDAVRRFLIANEAAHFLVAGRGEMMPLVEQTFAGAGLGARLHLAGAIEGVRLADTYAAMDVFAFSSHSETQGLVLAEAMAAGVPVVALDAPGAREIVSDGRNGRLLPADASADRVAKALAWVSGRDPSDRQRLHKAARQTARLYARPRTTRQTLALYRSLLAERPGKRDIEKSSWKAAMLRLGEEWKIFRNVAHAVGDAVFTPDLMQPARTASSPPRGRTCV